MALPPPCRVCGAPAQPQFRDQVHMRGDTPGHLVGVDCGWGELLGLVMVRMPPALRRHQP